MICSYMPCHEVKGLKQCMLQGGWYISKGAGVCKPGMNIHGALPMPDGALCSLI